MQNISRRIFIIAITLISIISVQAQENQVIDQIVAVVGKNIILHSDIENQYIQLKSQRYYSSGADIKCDIFEELLFQKLLLNQAQLDSIEVSDKEIESTLDRRMEYFIEQAGSKEKLEEYLKKSILEIKDDFKDMIKEQMITERMQGVITKDIKITPAEVREFFKKFPQDSLPIINPEFEIQQIVKYPPVSEEEINSVKASLEDFRERVKNGGNFGTLAVLYSEDPGSAKKKGELGFVGRGDLVPEFAAIAFKLKEGEVSRIVKTEFGYHIIQLIEKRGEKINARHILLKPKVSAAAIAQAKSSLDSIKTSIDNNEITFAEAAAKYSEDKNTSNNGGLVANPYTGSPKFEASQLDPTTFYAVNRLKTGDVSTPIETKDEKEKAVYKIVKLKSKTQPHKANLKDDYQRIQELAISGKKQKALEEWILQKQKSTYVHIDDSYKFCEFKYGNWIQK